MHRPVWACRTCLGALLIPSLCHSLLPPFDALTVHLWLDCNAVTSFTFLHQHNGSQQFSSSDGQLFSCTLLAQHGTALHITAHAVAHPLLIAALHSGQEPPLGSSTLFLAQVMPASAQQAQPSSVLVSTQMQHSCTRAPIASRTPCQSRICAKGSAVLACSSRPSPARHILTHDVVAAGGHTLGVGLQLATTPVAQQFERLAFPVVSHDVATCCAVVAPSCRRGHLQETAADVAFRSPE